MSSLIDIIFRTTKTGSGEKEAKSGLDNLNGAFTQLTGVSLTGAGAITAAGAALKFCTDQAFEAQRVEAATAAVIKSTGDAAGLSAEQIHDMATAQMEKTGIDDETIQSGENLLLTYDKIGKDTFPRATQAMMDMAVALAEGDTANIDLKNSATQLGKALQDPISGMSQLKRLGITFPDDIQASITAMVNMGNTAGAQSLMLDTLEKKFGGMADAMGGTDSGKMAIAQQNINNMAEDIGNKLIPILGDAAGALNNLVMGIDNVNAAFDKHKQDIVVSMPTYQAYETELVRSAVAAGKLSATMLDSHGTFRGTQSDLEKVTLAMGGLTQAEFDAQNKAAGVRGELEKLDGKSYSASFTLKINEDVSSTFLGSTPVATAAGIVLSHAASRKQYGDEDLVVPPGYSETAGTPYLIAASSGERVNVKRSGEGGSTGGDGQIVVNVYLDGQLIQRSIANKLRQQGF